GVGGRRLTGHTGSGAAGPEWQSDNDAGGSGAIPHRGERTRRVVGTVSGSLCDRVGQHAYGLAESGRGSLAVRVAGYWGTVLQQSVRPCRAGQLIGAP